MKNLLKSVGRKQDKMSNGDRLDIIICQLESMMNDEQLERFKQVRRECRK